MTHLECEKTITRLSKLEDGDIVKENAEDCAQEIVDDMEVTPDNNSKIETGNVELVHCINKRTSCCTCSKSCFKSSIANICEGETGDEQQNYSSDSDGNYSETYSSSSDESDKGDVESDGQKYGTYASSHLAFSGIKTSQTLTPVQRNRIAVLSKINLLYQQFKKETQMKPQPEIYVETRLMDVGHSNERIFKQVFSINCGFKKSLPGNDNKEHELVNNGVEKSDTFVYENNMCERRYENTDQLKVCVSRTMASDSKNYGLIYGNNDQESDVSPESIKFSTGSHQQQGNNQLKDINKDCPSSGRANISVNGCKSDGKSNSTNSERDDVDSDIVFSKEGEKRSVMIREITVLSERFKIDSNEVLLGSLVPHHENVVSTPQTLLLTSYVKNNSIPQAGCVAKPCVQSENLESVDSSKCDRNSNLRGFLHATNPVTSCMHNRSEVSDINSHSNKVAINESYLHHYDRDKSSSIDEKANTKKGNIFNYDYSTKPSTAYDNSITYKLQSDSSANGEDFCERASDCDTTDVTDCSDCGSAGQIDSKICGESIAENVICNKAYLQLNSHGYFSPLFKKSPPVVLQDKASPTVVLQDKASPAVVLPDKASPAVVLQDKASPAVVLQDKAAPAVVLQDKASLTAVVLQDRILKDNGKVFIEESNYDYSKSFASPAVHIPAVRIYGDVNETNCSGSDEDTSDTDTNSDEDTSDSSSDEDTVCTDSSSDEDASDTDEESDVGSCDDGGVSNVRSESGSKNEAEADEDEEKRNSLNKSGDTIQNDAPLKLASGEYVQSDEINAKVFQDEGFLKSQQFILRHSIFDESNSRNVDESDSFIKVVESFGGNGAFDESVSYHCLDARECDEGNNSVMELKCHGCRKVIKDTVYRHVSMNKSCQRHYDMSHLRMMHLAAVKAVKRERERKRKLIKLNDEGGNIVKQKQGALEKCRGCGVEFLRISSHLYQSENCRDFYDKSELKESRRRRSIQSCRANSDKQRALKAGTTQGNMLKKCPSCGKEFLRLFSHIAQVAQCKEFYGSKRLAKDVQESRRLRSNECKGRRYQRCKEEIRERQRMYYHRAKAEGTYKRKTNKERLKDRPLEYEKHLERSRIQHRESYWKDPNKNRERVLQHYRKVGRWNRSSRNKDKEILKPTNDEPFKKMEVESSKK